MNSKYVTTIGLEMHVELSTRTKLFCGCEVAFGGDPNTRVCPICLGHPGTLPVPNEKAVEYATKIAMALGCQIAPRSIFHRKNYFYPDMPKNYQISQYDIPIGSRGSIDIELDGRTRTIRITRVHLEEDTGKTKHVGGGGRIHEAEYSLEDFNRAGTPLVEIVTEPDLTSPEEARALALQVRLILEYLDVSDVRMEEGSLRFDANVSVGAPGVPGIKAEIKNMNSIRSLQRALAHEERRQQEVLEKGGALEQSTRHWDEERGVTTPLRTKEYAFDYRYLPEPDLVPIEPSVEWLRQLSEEVPELPAETRRRFVEELGLTPRDAGLLTSSKSLASFFESAAGAAKSSETKKIANWVANDLRGRLVEREEEIESTKVTPEALAKLVDLVSVGTITTSAAKDVLGEMLSAGTSPEEIVEHKGLLQVSDRGALEATVDQVISENPDPAQKVRNGEDKAIAFLIGRAMKATGGRGNASLIQQILLERLRGQS